MHLHHDRLPAADRTEVVQLPRLHVVAVDQQRRGHRGGQHKATAQEKETTGGVRCARGGGGLLSLPSAHVRRCP